ncbi:cytochrome c oxidase subunit 2 [Mucilaginibacter gracilis]|uniref:Cytochrome c oxidase subunit 2 n=1 Tax=Mucilaginibacter gracilis TaxID=423350 RepID=A0A495IXL4_9SPHI|nr:cytochrome c oxidase subunit II [Mucilaginibacter gracilis]RKR81425.1 cytochrome c oxidase subunit 2 [Mucilaginibacter gracilis]
MAFKKIFNLKTLSSAFAGMLLLATSTVMAQDTTATNSAVADDAAKSAMWTSVGYYSLLLVLVCIIVGIIGKILRVYDLTLQIQGKKAVNWNNVMGALFVLFLAVGLYGAFWSFTVQGSMLLPEAASIHGVKTDNMFMVTFGITVIVFVITQILLFTFSFKYRNTGKRKAYFYPHNNTIEKIWTVIPAIVLTILVITGFFTWKEITNTTEEKGDINVDVTGHQFAWEIRYPGKDGKLGSKKYTLYSASNILGVDFKDKNSFDDLHADTLVLPVNRAVRINISAQDVIHSVYMPHFRVQLNAVPGLPTYFKFTPTITTSEMRSKVDNPKFEYLLYCNKICGGSHYNMQKVVRIVTDAEYNDWLSKQKPYLSDALKKELKLADNGQTKEAAQNRLALNN